MYSSPSPKRSPGARAALRARLSVFAFSAGLVAAAAQAETVRFGGTGSSIGTMKRLAQAYQKVEPSFQLEIVPNLGSSGGIKAAATGAIQLAGTSRPIKADEAAAGLRSIEYGRTAFVIATNKQGLDNLSPREIADLYAGRRSQWPDGQTVRVVLRPRSDADAALLGSMSPDIDAALAVAYAREGMVVGMTDQDAVDAIERLPGSLGTATMALLLSEQRRARPVSIDGVAPTLSNVASGRYPYMKSMYVVVRGDASAPVLKFIDFVLSPAGQRVLAENGHLVSPTASAAR